MSARFCRFVHAVTLTAAVLCLAVPGVAVAETPDEFTDRMQSVTLVGRFTADRQPDAQPRRDRYQIASIEHVEIPRKLFHKPAVTSRMQNDNTISETKPATGVSQLLSSSKSAGTR